MTNNKQATALLAVALLTGSQAFIAPGGIPSVRSSSAQTCMSAQKPADGMKASAAAILAGIVSAGSLLSPVDASMFETSAAAPTVQEVGFGMPNPSSDPKNNNAASGKTNGDKYDIQQQGQFADKFSKGAVDYGSAKGTDFGKLGGNKQGIATENKATDGDFLADAKRDTQQGVKIAEKNVRDAANVNVKDVSEQGRGGATVQDGINKVKDILSSSAQTGSSGSTLVSGINIDVPNAVQQAGRQVQDGANAVADATSDLRDPNVDASIQTPKVGGFFGTQPRKQAQQVASKTGNKVRSDVNAVKSGAPTWGNAADAKNAVQNKVQSDVATLDRNTPNSINEVGQNIKNKVQSDVAAVDRNTPNSINQAGQGIKNKVSNDVQTAKNAAPDASNIGDAIRNKVDGGNQVRTLANSGAPDNAINNFGDALKNKLGGNEQLTNNGPEIGQNIKDKISASVGNTDANLPSGNDARNAADSAASGIKSALRDSGVGNVVEKGSPASTLLSVEGGFLGANSREQAQVTGQKTVDKVKSDIDTARSNPPFQNNGVSGGNAAQAVKGKVNSDIKNTRKTWEYTKNKVDNATPNVNANQIGNAIKGKVNSDVQTAKNAAPNNVNANQIGNAIKSKVGSDINTAKNAAPNTPDVGGLFSNAGKTVAQNAPEIKTPEVGGFFGQNPKQQADLINKKTAQKVKDDIQTARANPPFQGN